VKSTMGFGFAFPHAATVQKIALGAWTATVESPVTLLFSVTGVVSPVG